MADRYVWTPADGGPDIDLTDEDAGYSVEADGTRGLTSPPWRFTTSTYAGIDGDTVDAVAAQAARPALGMLVQARDPADLDARIRALVRAMRPKAGPGLLTGYAADGTSRSLRCYLEEGLGGDESEDAHMPGRWFRTVLRFYAPSPWWEGPEQTIDVGLAAPAAFFPIFPLVLSSSTIQGDFTVDLSAADDVAYPRWTVTGPGTSLVLTNRTTGKAIEVDAALGDGESLVIDTRRGRQSIRRLEPTAFAETRRNAATNPRAALTTDGWARASGGGTTTVERRTDGSPVEGGTYYRVAWTAPATNTAGAYLGLIGTTAGAHVITVTGGTTITCSAYARSSKNQRLSMPLFFYDAAGTFSSPPITSARTVAAGTWERFTETVTVPAGAVRVAVGLYSATGDGYTAWAAGDTLDTTGVLVEQVGGLGDYFDGDTADTPTRLHDWTGTPHASPSTLQEPSAAVEGESLFDRLASDPALWPLVEGVNEVSALLSNAGTASRIRGVYRPRYAGV